LVVLLLDKRYLFVFAESRTFFNFRTGRFIEVRANLVASGRRKIRKKTSGYQPGDRAVAGSGPNQVPQKHKLAETF
jgi:hypothetical protein